MRHSIIKLSDEVAFTGLYPSSFETNRTQLAGMKQLLSRAMDTELTEKQRYCMQSYFLEGKKMYEIASELGVNPSTVTRHIKRAKNRLKRIARYY